MTPNEEIKIRERVLQFALSQLGKKYELGVENDPKGKDFKSWDCSELVQVAYQKAGLRCEDGSWKQREQFKEVKEPKEADLGFLFDEKVGRIGHVFMFAKAGMCIEAVGSPIGEVRLFAMGKYEKRSTWRGWGRHPDFL